MGVCKPIEPILKCRANKNLKIAAWDLETYTTLTDPHVYLSGVAWGDQFRQFNTDDNNLV